MGDHAESPELIALVGEKYAITWNFSLSDEAKWRSGLYSDSLSRVTFRLVLVRQDEAYSIQITHRSLSDASYRLQFFLALPDSAPRIFDFDLVKAEPSCCVFPIGIPSTDHISVSVEFFPPVDIGQLRACSAPPLAPRAGYRPAELSFCTKLGGQSAVFDVGDTRISCSVFADDGFGWLRLRLDPGAEPRPLVLSYFFRVRNRLGDPDYISDVSHHLMGPAAVESAPKRIDIAAHIFDNPNAGFVGDDRTVDVVVFLQLKTRPPRRTVKVPARASSERRVAVSRMRPVDIAADMGKKGQFVIAFVGSSESPCYFCAEFNVRFRVEGSAVAFRFGDLKRPMFLFVKLAIGGSVRRQRVLVCPEKNEFTMPFSGTHSDDSKMVVKIQPLGSFGPPATVVRVDPINWEYNFLWEIPSLFLASPSVVSDAFALGDARLSLTLLPRGGPLLRFSFADVPRDLTVRLCVDGKFVAIRWLSRGHMDVFLPVQFEPGDVRLDISVVIPPPGICASLNEQMATARSGRGPAGYAGLLNQGATCYMNSILQALFHLPAFRKIVYNMPTENVDNPDKSIPLNLQKLFCEMQCSDDPVSTTSVTKSFGWGVAETWSQHDIQEFLRVLMDNLMTKMEGTALEQSIPSLFRGTIRNYVRCTNVNYATENSDTFMDLQMMVQNCPTLRDSFIKYTAKELMSGANQVSAGDFGKQDAEMGFEFLEFPSVLHIHLMRFTYDVNQGRSIKLPDRFEFPPEIDLTEFLAKDAPGRSKSNLFDLYGVLVHAGGTMGGHYYAFLRTSTGPQWYLFNDSNVSKVTAQRSIVENYGAKTTSIRSSVANRVIDEYRRSLLYRMEKAFAGESSSGSSGYSGYMLIYIRRDDANLLMEPIPVESIPRHLRDFYEEERCAKSENLTVVKVSYAGESTLRTNTVNHIRGFLPENPTIWKSLPSTTTYHELYELLGAEYGSRIRIWACDYQKLPSAIVPDDPNRMVSEIAKRSSLPFFVQAVPDGEDVAIGAAQMIWAKFYFPGQAAPLQYVGCLSVPPQATFATIARRVNEIIGFPDDTPLDVFSDTSWGLRRYALSDSPRKSFVLALSAVLVFQVTPTAPFPSTPLKIALEPPPTPCASDRSASDDLEVYDVPLSRENNVETYLGNLSRLEIEVWDMDKPQNALFILAVPQTLPFTEIKRIIGSYIGYEDYLKLTLLKAAPTPGGGLKFTVLDVALYSIPQYCLGQSQIPKEWKRHHLFFQVRALAIGSGEGGSMLRVQVSLDGGRTISFEENIPGPKKGSCRQVIQAMRQLHELPEGPFRVLTINASEVTGLALESGEYEIGLIHPPNLRIETIPPDQLGHQGIWLPAGFYTDVWDSASWHSKVAAIGAEPFLLPVVEGEVFSRTKERLKGLMEPARAEAISEYTFRVGSKWDMKRQFVLKDDDVLSNHIGRNAQFLIIAPGTAPAKRAIKIRTETSVRIYN
jgi:ubiquitin C-terminal hydrolase